MAERCGLTSEISEQKGKGSLREKRTAMREGMSHESVFFVRSSQKQSE
jgi:hypothetical protein